MVGDGNGTLDGARDVEMDNEPPRRCAIKCDVSYRM